MRARIILRMKDADRQQAEAWLTERLNREIQLEHEGSGYVEVPAGK